MRFVLFLLIALSVAFRLSAQTEQSIEVLFNYGTDASVGLTGNEANGNTDFAERLAEYAQQATSSIDIAVYSFWGLDEFIDAVVQKHEEGVRVRVIYEDRNDQSGITRFRDAGIPIIKHPSDIDGLMHHKFVIIDQLDGDPENDYVWSGSFNLTEMELDWKNNVVVFKHTGIAQAYTAEFEEMWGGSGDQPNSGTAKFGDQKVDDTEHLFSVNGVPVEIYFSPSDNTGDKILDELAAIDQAAYFAINTFTLDEATEQLQTKASSGADIRGIIDWIEASGSEYNTLTTFADVHEWPDDNSRLHHKYCVIDPFDPADGPVVITGSQNWTFSGQVFNDENMILIRSQEIADQYLKEFKARYNESGGTADFPEAVTSIADAATPLDFQLFQNYPNPFNPSTTIACSLAEGSHIALAVYNVLGERVTVLADEYRAAGSHQFQFDASGLPGGVYIYTLSSPEGTQSAKMILLK